MLSSLLADLRDVAVPLRINTYPIRNVTLCGSERYHAYSYPTKEYLDFLE